LYKLFSLILQMRSRGANGQSHTSFLSPVPVYHPPNGTLGLAALDDDTLECGLVQKNCTQHLMTRSTQTKNKFDSIFPCAKAGSHAGM